MGFSETLALAVVVSKGIPQLKDALINEPEDHLKAASAWSLGQIGRHTPDHARALAEADCLRRLLAVYLHTDSSDDLKTKAKRALKSVIQKCTHLPALEPLLQESPANILKYVVQQFAKVLPHDNAARRSFVQSGGLQKIQECKTEVGSKLPNWYDGWRTGAIVAGICARSRAFFMIASSGVLSQPGDEPCSEPCSLLRSLPRSLLCNQLRFPRVRSCVA